MTGQGARAEARGVSKAIDDIPLVHPIDLVAEPGECIVVRDRTGRPRPPC